MSCTFTDHTEWMLFDEIFKKICVPPDIDLFANGLNEYDRLNMFLVNKIQNLALFTHFQKIGNNLLIQFSSIQLNLEDTIKNKKRIIKSTTDKTIVEHTELTLNDSQKYNKNTNNIQQSTSTIIRDKQQTSTVPKTKN